MFRRFSAFALVLVHALASVLAAAPADAQEVTVRYAWLQAPAAGGSRPQDQAMLMLACPAGDGGPAVLSIAQPAVIERGSTHLLDSFRGKGQALFQDPFAGPNAQLVLTQIRSAFTRGRDTTFHAAGKALHLVPVPFPDTVTTLSSALLAVFGAGVRLAATCPRGLPERAAAAGTAGVRQVVQAGDYVFVEREPAAGAPAAQRLESAVASFLYRLAPVPDDGTECSSIPPALLDPLASPAALQARNRPLVLEPGTAPGEAWVISNGALAPRTLAVGLAATRLGAERFSAGGVPETLTITACGRFEITSRRAADAVGDTVQAVVRGDSLLLTLAPALAQGEDGASRTVEATLDADRLDLKVGTGGGWPGWLLPLIAIALLGAGAGVTRAVRRLRAGSRFEDRTRYLDSDELANRLELALHLQELPVGEHPQRLKELWSALPSKARKRLARFQIADAQWRRDLWSTINTTPESLLRKRGRTPRTPKRSLLPWGRGAVEADYGFTPRDEATALFILQDCDPRQYDIHPSLVPSLKAFPSDEVEPERLRTVLAYAVNLAIEATPGLTRDRLIADLPRYFVPEPHSAAGFRTTRPLEQALAGTKDPDSRVEGSASSVPPSPEETQPAGAGRAGDGPPAGGTPAGAGMTPVDDAHAGRLLVRVEALLERDEDIARALERAQRAEGERDETGRELARWRQVLAAYGQTADEVADEARRQRERAEQLGAVLRGLARTAGERLDALLDPGEPGIDLPAEPAALAAGAQAAAEAVVRRMDRLSAALERVVRARATELYRTPDAAVRLDPSVPVLAQLERDERLASEVRRIHQATRRTPGILALRIALAEAGRTLAELGEARSRLDATDLAPAELARQLREMGAAADTRWHELVLAAARAAGEGGHDASADLSLDFIDWLLGNARVQSLTQLLRLREVIGAYFHGSGAEDAESLYRQRQEYDRACESVILCLRGLGVYLDRVSYLKPPPAGDGGHFENIGGRPLILSSPALQDIVVARVRAATRELSETIADVSDWGYACPGLPFTGKPTRGWLCRGLEDL